MSKRLIRKASLLLSMMLVFMSAFLLSVPALAYAADPVVIDVSTASAQPGSTVKLTADVSSNPGFSSLGLTVNYNHDLLTLTNVAPTGLLAGKFVLSLPSVNDNFGYIQSGDNITATGDLVELTFNVASDAPIGSTTPVSISIKGGIPKNLVNSQGDTLSLTSVAGVVTISQTPGGGTGPGDDDPPPGGDTTPPGNGTTPGDTTTPGSSNANTGNGGTTYYGNSTAGNGSSASSSADENPTDSAATLGRSNTGNNAKDGQTTIPESLTPLGLDSQTERQWALPNLILAALCLLAAVFVIIRFITTRRYEDRNVHPALLIIAIVAAVASTALFILTQDLTQQMQTFDEWTTPFAVLAVCAAGSAVLAIVSSQVRFTPQVGAV